MRFFNIFIIVLMLLASGCQSTKSIKTSPNSASKAKEEQCFNSCKVIAKCARLRKQIYSDHDISACALECISSPEKIRNAVSHCAEKYYSKTCNRRVMSNCVNNYLK